MKQKSNSKQRSQPSQPPVVDPRLLESAKKTVFEPAPTKTFKCRVCNSKGATDQSEGLCWVCRRLKISAWKEIEHQVMFTE